MKEFASQKVSLGEKVGYSLGDAAANLVFQTYEHQVGKVPSLGAVDGYSFLCVLHAGIL